MLGCCLKTLQIEKPEAKRKFDLHKMADKGGTGNDTNSGKLQNPFAKDREGFISFSSSTPQLTSSGGGGARNRDKFVPRRGKANRMSNWKNFGDSVADEDRNQFSNARPSEVSSPYRGGEC